MKIQRGLVAVLAGMMWVSTVMTAHAAAINVGDWFVTDTRDFGNGTVVHLNSNGTVVEEKGNFSDPKGMDVGPDGNLHVGIGKTDEIVQFPQTNFQGTTTIISSGLNNPFEVEFGPDRNLFSGNGGLGNVQRFNGPFNSPVWGGQVTFGGASLGNPGGMTFGPGGDLYVADNNNAGEIERYNGLTGVRIGTSPFVSDSGNFDDGFDLVFGPDRNLYVSVIADNEILRYQGPNGASPGTFIDAFVPSVPVPAGMEFGDDGNLFLPLPLGEGGGEGSM